MSKQNIQGEKRFYIGTMFEYQLAKQYIQEGRGCTIQACTRSFEPVAHWSVTCSTSWSKQVQVALSKWFRLLMESVPEVRFLVDTEGH